MTGQDRFEADLRGWLYDQAPQSAPGGLVATGMSEVRATPQHRTLARLFATPLAARFAVAGVVVAGAIAAAFLLDLVPVSGPSGTSSTPSASPAYDVTCALADGCDELLPVIRDAVSDVGAQISSVNVDDGTYCLVDPFDPVICGLVDAPDGATYIARARVRFTGETRQVFLNLYRFAGADGQLSGRIGSDARPHEPPMPEAPTLTCGNPRCTDVIPIVTTAVSDVGRSIRSIDVSTGAYCLGDPFHPIPCPGPYKEGAETIGSAEVTFWGSPLHAFFNLFLNEHGTIIYDMNVLPEPGSTQPPATSSPGSAFRYDDGIPRTFDGQPVLRGSAARSRADSAVDDSSFLVGGWMTVPPAGVVYGCTPMLTPPWTLTCGGPTLTDVAGSEGVLWQDVERRLVFTGVDFRTARTGAAILRVHVHDPRSADCGSNRDVCDAAVVVEAIVWNGDSVTEPQPLTAATVESALRSVQSTALLVATPVRTADECPAPLPTARQYGVSDTSTIRPQVVWVDLSPSAEALARGLPIATGADAALAPAAVYQTSTSTSPSGTTTFTCRWVGVANVAVMVRSPGATLTAAGETFIRRLVAALEAAASANGPR